jgi:hypothetical protein
MRRIGLLATRWALLAFMGALLLIGSGGSAARATTTPVGACCLASGRCVSVNEFDCDGQGGNFIGSSTSCLMIDCPTLAIGAPVLSILGLVAAVGALAGLALYRLVIRRPS